MNLPFLETRLGDDPIELEVLIAASPARVFSVWTDAEQIKHWFGSDEGGPEYAEVDAKEGGKWEFKFAEDGGVVDCLGGTYQRVDTGRLLQFTWVHTRRSTAGEECSGESLVTVEFEPRDNGCRLRLRHQAVSTESARSNIGGGWSSSLNKLQALVEQA